MILATLIGFGEAGQAFAAMRVARIRAYDIDKSAAKQADYARCGVEGCPDLADALADATVILSVVTADQALAAAEQAAPHIAPGAFYFDMNSVAPDTKRAAASRIAAAGGRYIDVAVMAPVLPARLSVPLLVSGSEADAAATVLAALGFTDARVLGGDVGRASTVKMVRSVMVKGIEALTAEMMLAARAAGVTNDVLASLGDGWTDKAAYNLERMATHGPRRAAEMEEAAKTLAALGVEPVMTRGTIVRQRDMAARPLEAGA